MAHLFPSLTRTSRRITRCSTGAACSRSPAQPSTHRQKVQHCRPSPAPQSHPPPAVCCRHQMRKAPKAHARRCVPISVLRGTPGLESLQMWYPKHLIDARRFLDAHQGQSARIQVRAQRGQDVHARLYELRYGDQLPQKQGSPKPCVDVV